MKTKTKLVAAAAALALFLGATVSASANTPSTSTPTKSVYIQRGQAVVPPEQRVVEMNISTIWQTAPWQPVLIIVLLIAQVIGVALSIRRKQNVILPLAVLYTCSMSGARFVLPSDWMTTLSIVMLVPGLALLVLSLRYTFRAFAEHQQLNVFWGGAATLIVIVNWVLMALFAL